VVSRSSELHSHTHRMPALDGVRGLAILLVLGAHTHDPQLLPSGMVGVDLFFVLSGFLITSILLDESRRTGTIHLGRFYLRRFLRLYPALVVVLLFTIVYSSVVDPPEVFQRTLADAWRVMFYYYNWHLVWPIPHLATSFMHLHLWSLSIEEQFYLVWPALLLLLLWWHASKRVTWGMLAVAVIAPALARIAVWHLYDPAEWWGRFRSIWIYFRTDLRIDALMWGAALAWLLYQGYKPGNRMRAAVACGSVAAFAGLIVYASFHSFMNGIFHRGGMSLVGFLSALLSCRRDLVSALAAAPFARSRAATLDGAGFLRRLSLEHTLLCHGERFAFTRLAASDRHACRYIPRRVVVLLRNGATDLAAQGSDGAPVIRPDEWSVCHPRHRHCAPPLTIRICGPLSTEL
jgi:peptidoglycan/LPS O-acetylase OafA/YrhL